MKKLLLLTIMMGALCGCKITQGSYERDGVTVKVKDSRFFMASDAGMNFEKMGTNISITVNVKSSAEAELIQGIVSSAVAAGVGAAVPGP